MIDLTKISRQNHELLVCREHVPLSNVSVLPSHIYFSSSIFVYLLLVYFSYFPLEFQFLWTELSSLFLYKQALSHQGHGIALQILNASNKTKENVCKLHSLEVIVLMFHEMKRLCDDFIIPVANLSTCMRYVFILYYCYYF